MGRSLFIVPCTIAVIAAACTSPPSNTGLTANVTAVRVTRDPGLIVMPPLDRTISDETTARRLANDVIALPVMPSGGYSCPADFGLTYKLQFSGTRPWSAEVDVFGCRTVSLSNRQIRWFIETPSFASDLARALSLNPEDFAPLPCSSSSETHCYPQPQSGKGVIVGGIDACSGLGVAGSQYVAGTVAVHKGSSIDQADVTQSLPRNSTPPSVVAQESVAANHLYAFALDPGNYLLVADYQPPIGIEPVIAVSVTAGAATQVDIPNRCK